jgi:hypothetical protein
LGKRRKLDVTTCLFCGEEESIKHLFFDCVVAKKIWEEISEILGFEIGRDYEAVAKCWLCNKRFGAVNVVTSTICWCICKVRNLLCFQDVAWLGMKMVW